MSTRFDHKEHLSGHAQIFPQSYRNLPDCSHRLQGSRGQTKQLKQNMRVFAAYARSFLFLFFDYLEDWIYIYIEYTYVYIYMYMTIYIYIYISQYIYIYIYYFHSYNKRCKPQIESV